MQRWPMYYQGENVLEIHKLGIDYHPLQQRKICNDDQCTINVRIFLPSDMIDIILQHLLPSKTWLEPIYYQSNGGISGLLSQNLSLQMIFLRSVKI